MHWGERYETVAEVLDAVGAPIGAADSQGMLCGLLIGRDEALQAEWIAEVLSGTEPRGDDARACLETLSLLYDETCAALDDDAFLFEPMLPAEERPLPVRARALAAWCSGFLFGLGRSEPGSDADLPADVREILVDLAEIARVAAEPGDDAGDAGSEEEEEAFVELLEYLRAAVLLCREHLAHPSVRQPGAES